MAIYILAISQKYYKAISTNSWDNADMIVMKTQSIMKKTPVFALQHQGSDML